MWRRVDPSRPPFPYQPFQAGPGNQTDLSIRPKPQADSLNRNLSYMKRMKLVVSAILCSCLNTALPRKWTLSFLFLTSPSPLASPPSLVPLSNHLHIGTIPVELVVENVDVGLRVSLPTESTWPQGLVVVFVLLFNNQNLLLNNYSFLLFWLL